MLRAKPAASKGKYLRAVAVSTTMGPGIHIDPTFTKLDDAAAHTADSAQAVAS